MPPAPIVRKDELGNLVAIDGHNLIAVMYKLNEEINVHLASSADDGLPPDSQANIKRNQDLKEKFDTVIANKERLQRSDTASFSDLIARYKDLF